MEFKLLAAYLLACVLVACASERQAGPEAPAQTRAPDDPPHEPLDCPEEMVNVKDSFCIDRYEASRPDATATDPGLDETHATSRAEVLPWSVGDDNAQARDACLAAGKDLCTELQWSLACEGAQKTVYGYGNKYQPTTCNGIDLFGPGAHHLLPTGKLADCHSDYGVYDINGNLWEHVREGTGALVRGGAFDCGDSRRLHRCDYIPMIWTPLSLGFRCCLDQPAAADAD